MIEHAVRNEDCGELRLRIVAARERSYAVVATNGSAEASASFELPFTDLELENFLLRATRSFGRRGAGTEAFLDAKCFGEALFKAAFKDEVHCLYRDAVHRSASAGANLRITLCLSGAPELIGVPWEYLYDSPNFLALSTRTPIVRYLDLPHPPREVEVEPPLKILGIVSAPADYERLDAEAERAKLEQALAAVVAGGAVELCWLERPTVPALLHALQSDPFHALHFIGHGGYAAESDAGFLVFEDDGGWGRPVTGEELAIILHDFTALRLAVLNACQGARTGRADQFSGVAEALVQREIPAVISMQREVSDTAAIAFAQSFYSSVAAGSPLDAGVSKARLAMLASEGRDIEWGTPALFMRAGNARLFGSPAVELPEQRMLGAAVAVVQRDDHRPSDVILRGLGAAARVARLTVIRRGMRAAGIATAGAPPPVCAEGGAPGPRVSAGLRVSAPRLRSGWPRSPSSW